MKKIIFGLAYLFFVPVVSAQDITVPKPPGVAYENIGKLLSNFVGLALIVAALLVFAYMVWGGVQWITSGGDKAGVEAARGRITAALIGLAIVASAWAVIKIIETFFGICILGCTISVPRP